MVPFSAHRPATRCTELPRSARSRSGVSRRCSICASADIEQRRRPCGFTLCEYDAVELDARTCRLRFRRFSFDPREAAAKAASQCQHCLRSFLLRTVRRIRLRSRSGSTRHIKRLRFANSLDRASHASPVLWAMFRYRSRAIAAWPNEWVLPSVSFGGAPGVFIDALRRVAPTNGWRIISDQAGPTCLLSNRTPR